MADLTVCLLVSPFPSMLQGLYCIYGTVYGAFEKASPTACVVGNICVSLRGPQIPTAPILIGTCASQDHSADTLLYRFLVVGNTNAPLTVRNRCNMDSQFTLFLPQVIAALWCAKKSVSTWLLSTQSSQCMPGYTTAV